MVYIPNWYINITKMVPLLSADPPDIPDTPLVWCHHMANFLFIITIVCTTIGCIYLKRHAAGNFFLKYRYLSFCTYGSLSLIRAIGELCPLWILQGGAKILSPPLYPPLCSGKAYSVERLRNWPYSRTVLRVFVTLNPAKTTILFFLLSLVSCKCTLLRNWNFVIFFAFNGLSPREWFLDSPLLSIL